jgi:hypothetical protein
MNKAQCLTRYIKHLAESANFKGSTFNKHRNGLMYPSYQVGQESHEEYSDICCNKGDYSSRFWGNRSVRRFTLYVGITSRTLRSH